MNRLTITDLKEIINGHRSYSYSEQDTGDVLKSFNFLESFSKNNLVYGVNTGFGPMADFKVNKEGQIKLQYNLIRSHSSGMGAVLPTKVVKIIMIIRLHTFLQGKSGVSQSLINTLSNYIDNGIYPDIYEHGGVGASGDLVQLAHLALGIIGEYLARVHYTRDKNAPTASRLRTPQCYRSLLHSVGGILRLWLGSGSSEVILILLGLLYMV